MLDILQPQSIASYINEIRKTDPVKKPAIMIPAKAEIKIILSKKEESAAPPDLSFEKWNLPPQPEGYIKCGRHDFL
jgi:hypothetical protein